MMFCELSDFELYGRSFEQDILKWSDSNTNSEYSFFFSASEILIIRKENRTFHQLGSDQFGINEARDVLRSRMI